MEKTAGALSIPNPKSHLIPPPPSMCPAVHYPRGTQFYPKKYTSSFPSVKWQRAQWERVKERQASVSQIDLKQSSLFQSLALLHLPFQSCGMLPVSEPSEESQVQIHLLLSSVHLQLGFLRFNQLPLFQLCSSLKNFALFSPLLLHV